MTQINYSNKMKKVTLAETIQGYEGFKARDGEQLKFKLYIHQYFDTTNVSYKRLYPYFPSYMKTVTDSLYQKKIQDAKENQNKNTMIPTTKIN
ncbi:unnamed protein product [Ambrosiozyma monospora]|uniref:Unnamed protein product n=1 Tax=Ambrosiozyma monospora TaxID=43982 RepID=A0ACB5TI87_AMBMO|nr:unnamed protein product [Ambrosiozyma monospora]